MNDHEIFKVVLARLDRIEDKLDSKIAKQDERLDRIEQDLSKAQGWTKAMLSVAGLCVAFGVELFRRTFIGT